MDIKAKRILVRGDDLGETHSVNLGFKLLLEKGLLNSMSIMAPCPWFNEAIELAKQHPEVDLGVHITLNCPYTNYRWGPVLGANRVPSLVDENGELFSTPIAMMKNKIDQGEVEAEIRAQVRKVVRAGVQPVYLDSHMANCQFYEVFKVAADNVAKEFGIQVVPDILDETGESYLKAERTRQGKIAGMQKWFSLDMPEGYYYHLMVIHPRIKTHETDCLTLSQDISVLPDLAEAVADGIAETEAASSVEIGNLIKHENIIRVRYRDLPKDAQFTEFPLWPPEVVKMLFDMFGAAEIPAGLG